MNKTLEQDKNIWEALTKFVCGRDMEGLNYYKNDIIEGFKAAQQSHAVSGDVEEMDRAINCLAIELSEPVWDAVNKKWQEFKAGYAAAPQKGMKETFDGPYDVGNNETEYVAILEGFPGMVVSGKSKKEAWQEMLKSIKVLIAFNSGIDSNELRTLDESPSDSEE